MTLKEIRWHEDMQQTRHQKSQQQIRSHLTQHIYESDHNLFFTEYKDTKIIVFFD